MPLTFYMTNDQKPLVIIYGEKLTPQQVQTMFSSKGYQPPEVFLQNNQSYNAELAEQGIPDNNRILIFANKREEQIYNDPTMAQILEVLQENGIKIDSQIKTQLQPLLEFKDNLEKQAKAMGLELDTFRQMAFEEGDRISPLIPGLREFLSTPQSNDETPPTLPHVAPTHFYIQPSTGRASIFNALAIALAVKILHGDLDAQQHEPIFKALVDGFQRKNVTNGSLTWKALKFSLQKFNAKEDIEALLAPILFQLTYKFLLRKELINIKSQIDQETATQLTKLSTNELITRWAAFTANKHSHLLSYYFTAREGANWLPKLYCSDDIDTEFLHPIWMSVEKKILEDKRPDYGKQLREEDIQAMISELFSETKAQDIAIRKEGFQWVVELDPSLSGLIGNDVKKLNRDLDSNFMWPADSSETATLSPSVPIPLPHTISGAPSNSTLIERKESVVDTSNTANTDTPLTFVSTGGAPKFPPQKKPAILARRPNAPPTRSTPSQLPPKPRSSAVSPSNMLLSAQTSTSFGNVDILKELSRVCEAYCKDKFYFYNAYHIPATNTSALLDKIISTYQIEKFAHPDHFLAIILNFVLGQLSKLKEDTKFLSYIEKFRQQHSQLLKKMSSPAMSSPDFVNLLNKKFNLSEDKFDAIVFYDFIRTCYSAQFPSTAETSDSTLVSDQQHSQ